MTPTAIMPTITMRVSSAPWPRTIIKPMPLLAAMSSAPIRLCQPAPALMRRPAMMDGSEAGSSTS